MSFKNEGEIRLLSYIQNMKESTTSRPTLQKILKDVLQAKEKRYWIKIWIYTKEERALQIVTT